MILLEIALYFMVLSIFSVGGLPSVMPEMQRYVVEVKSWMSRRKSATAAPRPR